MCSQRLQECFSLLPVVQSVAVRTALESQLIACGVVPVGFHLSVADLWLGRKPLDSSRLHRLVWDMCGVSGSHTCHGPRPLYCMGYCPFAP
jgi:hypothetical protein